VVRRNPNSFAQTNIDREIGLRRRSRYVLGLWPDACAAGIDDRPEQVLSQSRIRLFDKDPIGQTLYVVQGSNSVCRQPAYVNETQRNPYISTATSTPGPSALSLRESYSHYPRDEVTRTTSTVSSLSFLPATGALAVTTYGSDRPPEVWLSDPGRDDPVSHTSINEPHMHSVPPRHTLCAFSSL
jgi:dipeptidyl aminopeptidase/acylaminoacyl peptidase